MAKDFTAYLTPTQLSRKYHCSLEVSRNLLARSEVAKWRVIEKETERYTKCVYIWNEMSKPDFDYVYKLKGFKRDV